MNITSTPSAYRNQQAFGNASINIHGPKSIQNVVSKMMQVPVLKEALEKAPETVGLGVTPYTGSGIHNMYALGIKPENSKKYQTVCALWHSNVKDDAEAILEKAKLVAKKIKASYENHTEI